MVRFFIEGGWGMYPVLVLGLILVWSSGRYALDLEPARLRFIVAMSVALLVTMAHATWTCFAAVFQYLHRSSTEPFAQTLMTGLMESTRPATLGGPDPGRGGSVPLQPARDSGLARIVSPPKRHGRHQKLLNKARMTATTFRGGPGDRTGKSLGLRARTKASRHKSSPNSRKSATRPASSSDWAPQMESFRR
jgi:hypothetical protein